MKPTLGNGPSFAAPPASSGPPSQGHSGAPVAPSTAPPSGGASQVSPRASEVLERLRRAIGEVVVGYEDAVAVLAIALVSEGHVLVEGVPGLAKTSLVRAFARALALSFRRIQFTPDMLPSDILGTVVLNPREQQFEFRPGPVFAHVILADEINRAPPKVQSAFLEAMQERQVTIDGTTYALPRPFLVIATENPIEHEGTYPLPAAELDRFLFRWILDYPTEENETQILRSRTAGDPVSAVGLVSTEEVLALRRQHERMYVCEDVLRYITEIIRTTRSDADVQLGASPRAGVHLLHAAQAAALFAGRPYVIPDDVRDLVFPLLNHRLLLRPGALARDVPRGRWHGPDPRLREVILAELAKVTVPRRAQADTWGRP